MDFHFAVRAWAVGNCIHIGWESRLGFCASRLFCWEGNRDAAANGHTLPHAVPHPVLSVHSPPPKQVSDGGVASVLQLLHLFLEQPRWEETAMERSKQQVGGELSVLRGGELSVLRGGELSALRGAGSTCGLACAPAQACSQRQQRAGALVCPALPMITRPAAWLALSFLTVALFSHPCSPACST